MLFDIPDVPMIRQTQTWACWYAAAQMLIKWRRDRTRMSEIRHPDPSELPDLQAKFVINTGLSVTDVVTFAKELGLQPVAPMTPTPLGILELLASHGPLWFGGAWGKNSGHVVVITGVDDKYLHINDPARGAGIRMPFSEYADHLQPIMTGAGVMPNLLYFPD